VAKFHHLTKNKLGILKVLMDFFFLKNFPNSPDPEEAKGCENPHMTTARMFPDVFPSSSQFVHIKFQPCSQNVTQYVPN
jgi:hypothetical protein